MDKVSIVMPAYNAETNLPRSVKSVLRQTYENVELIIVDDGSIDGTYAKAEELAGQNRRITVIHQDNAGVSTARNVGIQAASGVFVAFLDADDEMEPDFLSIMVPLMTSKIDIAVCGFATISSSGEKLFTQSPTNGQWMLHDMYKPIAQLQDLKAFNILWNKLFRMDIIRMNGITMDVSVTMGEDFLFIVDYLSRMKGGMAVTEKPLYRYTLSPTGLQVTANGGETLDRDLEQINRLRALFERNHYPLDAIYMEYTRYMYVAVQASKDVKTTILSIRERKEYRELQRIHANLGLKYTTFIHLIAFAPMPCLQVFLNTFKATKKVSGKNWIWN